MMVKIYYCPHCGSGDIKHDGLIYGAGCGIYCKDCETQWHIIEENVEKD